MQEFLIKNSKLLVFSLVGLILIGLGVISFKTNMFASGDKVEVLNSNTENNTGPDMHQSDIIVEISGAVEKEGVYKLPNDSRVNDLIISAGGISVDADRDWITKNINKAAKLIDGQKVYIYSSNETQYHSGEVSAKKTGGYPPAGGQVKLDQPVLGVSSQNISNLVNINTASQSELEKLSGIGPVYATNIIEHRPYSTVEELVSKGAISKKVFEKIKNSISL